MERWLFTLAVLSGIVAADFGGSSSTSTPTSPTASGVTLSGTYSGQASDSSGSGSMTWILSQSGTTVSGNMTAATPQGTLQFRGNVSGSLSGTKLTFTITVPQGDVSTVPTCTIAISGGALGVTATRISGTYSGTSTCTPPFTNGQFTLNKH